MKDAFPRPLLNANREMSGTVRTTAQGGQEERGSEDRRQSPGLAHGQSISLLSGGLISYDTRLTTAHA